MVLRVSDIEVEGEVLRFDMVAVFGVVSVVVEVLRVVDRVGGVNGIDGGEYIYPEELVLGIVVWVVLKVEGAVTTRVVDTEVVFVEVNGVVLIFVALEVDLVVCEVVFVEIVEVGVDLDGIVNGIDGVGYTYPVELIILLVVTIGLVNLDVVVCRVLEGKDFVVVGV